MITLITNKLPFSDSKSWVLILFFCVLAQLNRAGAQDRVTIKGNLNAGGEVYDVNGISSRRSPYSYSVAGTINFAYKGFNLPITGSYRDAQFSYDYTFNRLGLSPSYKWVKLHLGWSNINYSAYTLSGRSFFGVGLELTPGKWYFSALKGKLQNPLAIKDTLVYGANLIPGYERNIEGAKFGYRKSKSKLELMAVRTFDDVNGPAPSGDVNQLYGYQVLTPKENLTLGLNAGLELFKRIELFLNTGLSAYTADALDTFTIKYGNEVPAFAKDLFQANSTSRFSLAGDGGINLRIRGNKIGFKYRRVDPFYSNLAANFFQNDIEQITFTTGLNLFKRKLRFDGQLGMEHNNLTQLRSQTANRVIGNAGINLVPSEKLNLGLRYTNYQTESMNEILQLNDTLRFVTVSSQYGFNADYTVPGLIKRMNFTLYLNYNTVKDESQNESLGDISVFTAGLSHGLTFTQKELSIYPSINYNQYQYRTVDQTRYGLGLRVAKKLLDKKLMLNVGGQLFFNQYNGLNDGTSSNLSLNGNYRFSPKRSITLTTLYRINESIVNRSYTEWRSTLKLSQSF